MVETLLHFGANINNYNTEGVNILYNDFQRNCRWIKLFIDRNLDVNYHYNFQMILDDFIGEKYCLERLHLLIDGGLDTRSTLLMLKPGGTDREYTEEFILLLLTLGFTFDLDYHVELPYRPDADFDCVSQIWRYRWRRIMNKKINNCVEIFPKVVTLRTMCIRIVKRNKIDVKLQKSCPLIFQLPDEMEEEINYDKRLQLHFSSIR